MSTILLVLKDDISSQEKSVWDNFPSSLEEGGASVKECQRTVSERLFGWDKKANGSQCPEIATISMKTCINSNSFLFQRDIMSELAVQMEP